MLRLVRTSWAPSSTTATARWISLSSKIGSNRGTYFEGLYAEHLRVVFVIENGACKILDSQLTMTSLI
jgi:hypothetical protein